MGLCVAFAFVTGVRYKKVMVGFDVKRYGMINESLVSCA